MFYREIKSTVAVAEEDVQQLQETVKSILARVKSDGDGAVRYFEKEFDNFDPPSFRISEAQAAKAVEQLPAEVVEELDFAIEQLTAFARAQRDSMVEFEKEIGPGMIMGQRIIPVESCGCYVPAGRYPCLTSAVMSVIPAEVYADKIAGPNHILPTGAAARYTGGLWVGMFLKVVTHMEVDRQVSVKLAGYAETQGAYEGMDAHRFAAAIRIRDLKD